MDDIKAPSTAPSDQPDGLQGEQLETNEPGASPEHQQQPEHEVGPEPQPEKKGMKPWLVAVLVILALLIGAAGVYFWQQSANNSDESVQLQSQIDELNQDLEDAKKNASEADEDATTQEIKTLTEENDTLKAEVETLTKSNDALKTQNDTLTTENKALTDACEAATDCELPS